MSKTQRKIRAEFAKKCTYSKVIRMLAKGKESLIIAEKTGIPVASVRVMKGNCTRGFNLPYVQIKDGVVTGTCNF